MKFKKKILSKKKSFPKKKNLKMYIKYLQQKILFHDNCELFITLVVFRVFCSDIFSFCNNIARFTFHTAHVSIWIPKGITYQLLFICFPLSKCTLECPLFGQYTVCSAYINKYSIVSYNPLKNQAQKKKQPSDN